MMSNFLFGFILPATLMGSIFILLLLAFSPLQKRVPAKYKKNLWICSALLFLVPVVPLVKGISLLPSLFSFQSSVPAAAPIIQGLEKSAITAPAYHTGQLLQHATNYSATTTIAHSYSPLFPSPIMVISFAYFLGVIAFAIVYAGQALHFHKALKPSLTPLKGTPAYTTLLVLCKTLKIKHVPRLYASTIVSSPLIVGVFRPVIVIPAKTANENALRYALLHELTHFKSKDLLLKSLLLFIRILHWFNPLTLTLQKEMTASIEDHCDESVTDKLDYEQRLEYVHSLLSYATTTAPAISAGFSMPVKKLQKRLTNLLHPKQSTKKTRRIITAVFAVFFMLTLSSGIIMAAGTQAPQPAISSPVSQTASAPSSSSKDVSNIAAPASSSNVEYAWPVPAATAILRDFTDSSHRGIDIKAKIGSAIYAVADGIVEIAGSHYSYGNYVVIRHVNGYRTLYAHCSRLFVNTGDSVEQYDKIAIVGKTGFSSSNHLHLEFHESDDTLLNPLSFLAVPEDVGIVPVSEYDYFVFPVPDYTYSSRGFMKNKHNGQDINAPEGTPIYAARGGLIMEAGFEKAKGNYIMIQHSNGIITLYAHCDTLLVQKGDTIEHMQQIATIGSTGYSTDSHLHLEFWLDDTLLDPLDYITLPQ